MMGLIDKMEMIARHSGLSQDEFSRDFNYFLNGPEDSGCYVVKGPDWIVFGRLVDPEIIAEAPDEAWLIYYYEGSGLSRLVTLVEMGIVPQRPYVGFMRPLRSRKKLQFFPWDRIRRLCERF